MSDTDRPPGPVPRDPDLMKTVPFGLPPQLAPQPEVEEAGVLAVEVVGGPMDGLAVRREAIALTVGRGRLNDLALVLDSAVSSRHARIEREGDHYWLEDLDSSNGTYLGDKRIEGRVLIGAGTTFLVGSTRLEFMPV